MDTTNDRTITAADWGLLFFLGLLWGGSFFFGRIAVAEIPPLTLVLMRVAVAAVALHVWLRVIGLSFAPVLAAIPMFLGLSLLNNVIPFSLMFAGQTELGAGLASVLNATTPFWTMLLANQVGGEPIGRRKLAGILIGIAGTAIMVGPGLVAGIGGPVWAKLALIGTALSYACAALYAKRFGAWRPELIATGQLTASTVIMLPIALAWSGTAGLFPHSLAVWASVLGLGLASTALGYTIFFRLIRSIGPTNTSLVTLLVPISAILLGVLVLGERLELFELAGMATIGAGLLIIDGRLFSPRTTYRAN